MKKVELLSPAGSMDSLYAAVQNGADAVYLGGSKFSARAYASNFDEDNMIKAVNYCHIYGVKVYVTVNTLIKEHEMDEALEYINFLYDVGVDALIIQDTGLFFRIKEMFSDFELHASTQMTVHNGEGAIFLKNCGFNRIVLSRELSINEIEYISKKIGIETEVFIHGALCICYSGMCLMSSIIGGRSGNRGRCAQPCRLPYTIVESVSGVEKKGYVLSPKDLCTFWDIKNLVETGTSSLKIEGRMKRPEYVAGVVKAYRKALNFAECSNSTYNKVEGINSIMENEYSNLLQLFNREGFSKAYLYGNKGKDMMAYNYPKNTGVELGRVRNDFTVQISKDIHIGDGVRSENSGFTISKIIVNGKNVEKAYNGQKVKIYPQQFKPGDILYRTLDTVIASELESTYKYSYNKKIDFDIKVYFKIGEPLRINTLIDNVELCSEGEVVQQALKKPVLKEKLIENLSKTGDTPIRFSDISFVSWEQGFIPISAINEVRRRLVLKIESYIMDKYKRKNINVGILNEHIKHDYLQSKNRNHIPQIIAVVNTKEQYKAANKLGVDAAVNVFMKDSSIKIQDILDKGCYLKVPNIIKDEFNEVCDIIEKNIPHIKGIMTANLGIINRFKDRISIIGDYKLNIFNSSSVKFYDDYLDSICLSVELNRKEIVNMLKGFTIPMQVLLYGKIELMISEYCPIGSIFGGKCGEKKCSSVCINGKYFLKDRMGERFLIKTDKFCRSYVYNSVPTNLIPNMEDLKSIGVSLFRLDFTDESYEDTIKILESSIRGTWNYEYENYTRGHYKRGVE